jgi:uncharacterized paraquat-inducible protein A
MKAEAQRQATEPFASLKIAAPQCDRCAVKPSRSATWPTNRTTALAVAAANQ